MPLNEAGEYQPDSWDRQVEGLEAKIAALEAENRVLEIALEKLAKRWTGNQNVDDLTAWAKREALGVRDGS